ncbi:Uncharacterised protein [Mycobacteroides abscessus subsp. abscessus]|nr:Uncharacterised protein [Mycobacteroides abscessus subsp. abscessus]
MKTALRTRSGRARASSWATRAPIEVPTTSAGPSSRSSIRPAVSPTRSSMVMPSAASNDGAMPRLSKVHTR